MAQLKPEELFLVEKMTNSGVSGREIGRRLGKDPTVVNNEMRNNKWIDGKYPAHEALRRRQRRKRN